MTDRARGARARAAASPVLSASLPGTPESAGEARALIIRACREWSLSDIELDAKMVVSELVENAVRHGGGAGVVRVTLDGQGLTVAVEDHVSAPPVLQAPDPQRPGGRGLLLVDRLSREWGYRPTGDGKVVWARLRP
jgi:anti-sigma regulatory factor (Ser/Thr protein kinase)